MGNSFGTGTATVESEVETLASQEDSLPKVEDAPAEETIPSIPQEEVKDEPNISKWEGRENGRGEEIANEISRSITQLREEMLADERRVNEGKGIGFRLKAFEFNRDLARIERLLESLYRSEADAKKNLLLLSQLVIEHESFLQKKKEGIYLALQPLDGEDYSRLETQNHSFGSSFRKSGTLEKSSQGKEISIDGPNGSSEAISIEKETSSTPSLGMEPVLLARHPSGDQLVKSPSNGHHKVANAKVSKERVVLNNWANPLKRFLEQQSVQDNM